MGTIQSVFFPVQQAKTPVTIAFYYSVHSATGNQQKGWGGVCVVKNTSVMGVGRKEKQKCFPGFPSRCPCQSGKRPFHVHTPWEGKPDERLKVITPWVISSDIDFDYYLHEFSIHQEKCSRNEMNLKTKVCWQCNLTVSRVYRIQLTFNLEAIIIPGVTDCIQDTLSTLVLLLLYVR